MKWSPCADQTISPSKLALLHAGLRITFRQVWAVMDAVRVSHVSASIPLTLRFKSVIIKPTVESQ